MPTYYYTSFTFANLHLPTCNDISIPKRQSGIRIIHFDLLLQNCNSLFRIGRFTPPAGSLACTMPDIY